jgi:hypothetical protein
MSIDTQCQMSLTRFAGFDYNGAMSNDIYQRFHLTIPLSLENENPEIVTATAHTHTTGAATGSPQLFTAEREPGGRLSNAQPIARV